MGQKKSASTYTPKPDVPEAARERYGAVLRVLSGEWTVSEAARKLGMSRNRFQSLMHRGLEGLLEELRPQAPGRPARPVKEAALEEEVARLRRENARLQERVGTIDRLLGVASDMIQGRIRPSRPRRPKTPPSAKKATKAATDEEPEPVLAYADQLRKMGLQERLVSAIAGKSAATLRRWRARKQRGELPVGRAGARTMASLSTELRQRVRAHVVALHGLVGADSLRRTVPGVSRRDAARIKKETLTDMERNRIACMQRVEVSSPGAVRGFDAMHINTTEGRRYLLVSADAAVPFRTGARVADRYDSVSVVDALDRDFAKNGPPLVLRLDRASCHRTPDVSALLRSWGVLPLHGPARYPRFYGQLERQNREHRAWLRCLGELSPSALEHASEEMCGVLNGLWKRPTLGWRTAEQTWETRTAHDVNRDDMRQEVEDNKARLLATTVDQRLSEDAAQRLAIENWLTQRGYLRVEVGNRC